MEGALLSCWLLCGCCLLMFGWVPLACASGRAKRSLLSLCVFFCCLSACLCVWPGWIVFCLFPLSPLSSSSSVVGVPPVSLVFRVLEWIFLIFSLLITGTPHVGWRCQVCPSVRVCVRSRLPWPFFGFRCFQSGLLSVSLAGGRRRRCRLVVCVLLLLLLSLLVS